MPKDRPMSLKKYDGDPYIALAAAVVRRAVLDSQGCISGVNRNEIDYLVNSAKLWLNNGAGGLPELLSIVPERQAAKRTQREQTPQGARAQGTTLITFRCPMDIYKRLQEVTTRRGISISSYIVEALREELDRVADAERTC